MHLVPLIAEEYAIQHTTALPLLLQQIINHTTVNHPKHHMLSGVVQGQLLQILSRLIQPKYVLEVGTYTGFSALCMCTGLQPKGTLHTIELRQTEAATAQQFFNKSIYESNIKLHIGEALSIIPSLHHTWDMVYIDADKVNYSNYYDLILPQLCTNGLMIVDNVLFHGEVLSENVSGKNAIAINAFNKKINTDTSVNNVLLTIRDGLMLIQKTK